MKAQLFISPYPKTTLTMQTNNSIVEILLVEDQASDADITIRALQKNNIGNSILHVKDGKEAMDFIEAQGEYTGRNTNILPRAIILDLNMPRIGGLEVLQKLKTN